MKFFKFFVLLVVVNFLFVMSVFAECSYNERKDLLKEAKNIDVSYEVVDKGNNGYAFKFNVVGLSENIFIKYFNLNNGIENYIFFEDLENDVYSFVDENSNKVYQYKFIVYSLNSNCESQELYTKSIKKPMYNIYSENPNCQMPNNKNFKYCKKFLDEDYNLTLDKFNKAITDYNLKKVQNDMVNTEEKKDSKNLIKVISISLIFFILIIVFIVIYIKKKNKRIKL